MTLKMFDILEFPNFFNKVKTQKLPIKTSYRLTLLGQEIDKHTAYYQEQFRNILMEYGQKDESGNLIPTADNQGIMLIEDKIKEAREKIVELRELEVELPDYYFFIEEFEGIELTVEDMPPILPFIKE